MPSSTSSFERHVPELPFGRMAALAFGLALAFMVAWEAWCRSQGGFPTYNDSPGLWARSREQLRGLGPEAIVIVGDSRVRFDLDHKVLSEAFGGRPVVNLAMNGSVARPVLHEVAQDPAFRGLVLCSYTPSLFWVPGGPNIDSTMEFIEYEKRETIAAEWGQWLGMRLEERFAFMIKERFSLGQLLRALPIPSREGTRLPPRLPPYICTVHADRREEMWERLETDAAFQQELKDIWLGLLRFMQPLPPPLLAKLRGEIAADVAAIRARGGDVVFVAFPVTGEYAAIEEKNAPRAEYWEPLLREANAVGVHFQDHEGLRGFECPEWSHLRREDAVLFSTRLMPILKDAMAAKAAGGAESVR